MLAAELRDQLVVDDREGRRLAEERGITVIGTLGVLHEAAKLGLFDLRDCVASPSHDLPCCTRSVEEPPGRVTH